MSTLDSLVARINSHLAGWRSPESVTQPAPLTTDIHSHLLAGVDDGLHTHEEVVACLNQFVDWGFRHIVTTPHVSRAFYPNTSQTLLAGQAALRKLIEIYNLPLTIEVAAEYMVDDLFLELLEQKQLLSFGEQRYVLIELGWESPPALLETILFRTQVKGFQPVLAHPERYLFYHGNLKAFEKLRDLGCLFQLNWGSMVGQYGPAVKKQGHQLIQHKWVDFIGSDLHSPNDIPLFETFLHSSVYRSLNRLPLQNRTVQANLSTLS